jgi:hypothetical protein
MGSCLSQWQPRRPRRRTSIAEEPCCRLSERRASRCRLGAERSAGGGRLTLRSWSEKPRYPTFLSLCAAPVGGSPSPAAAQQLPPHLGQHVVDFIEQLVRLATRMRPVRVA